MAINIESSHRSFLGGVCDAGKMAVLLSPTYAVGSALKALCSVGYGFCSIIGYDDQFITDADRNGLLLLSTRRYFPRNLMKRMAIENGSKSLEFAARSVTSFLSGGAHLLTFGKINCKDLERKINEKLGIDGRNLHIIRDAALEQLCLVMR